jgi:hypothetical protein
MRYIIMQLIPEKLMTGRVAVNYDYYRFGHGFYLFRFLYHLITPWALA